MAIPLSEILAALGSEAAHDTPLDATILVEDVTADSRAARAGSLFVAVRGEEIDGHDFIPQALAQGAVAVLGEQSPAEARARSEPEQQTTPYIQVANARQALAWACAALHGYPSRALTVVGVTGTDGKTTTCTLIESILQAHTHSPAAPDSTVGVVTTVGARIRGEELDTGFHVTTPDAPEVQRFLAAMRDRGCTHAVVESTSHGLAQARVAGVDFDVAAVTNITHEHLDYHGTRDAYVAAKALLFRALYHRRAKPGVAPFAVLNGADPGSFDALQAALAEEAATAAVMTDAVSDADGPARAIPVRVYGLATGGENPRARYDVWAERVDYYPDRTEIQVRWWGGAFTLQSPLIGEFNVYNMLCAATVGLGLGIDSTTVQRGIQTVTGVSGRMERVDAGQPFLAIVDFAHSPVSLERALHTLRPLVGQSPEGESGRLIAVFGCAGLRDRTKRFLMGQVSGRLADYTVVTAEDPRTESLAEINREIERGLLASSAAGRYTIIEDRAAAIRAAVQMARPGDVIAAFGKGHERSMCFGTVEHPWSEQDAMLDALLDAPHAALHDRPKQT